MLKSMTGFGKSICELENKKVTVEIKSLNSKQLDLFTRIPSLYKEKDLIIRNEIAKQLERGKVELSVYIETIGTDKNVQINKALVENYCNQLSEVSRELGLENKNDFLSIIMKMPDTLKTERQEIDEEEWNKINDTIKLAVADLLSFREQEGTVLEKDLLARIDKIQDLLIEVEKFEEERINLIREKLNSNLEEFVGKENIDHNRFEQELIYYLEKLDVTEEKVRLKHHCDYFIETAKEPKAIGKKLGFISQEIGREINTLGSKANNSDLQKIVIQMKDELEKIKEQLLNIL